MPLRTSSRWYASPSRLLAAAMLLQQLLWPVVSATGYARCKSTPGTPLWPTELEWAKLDASLTPLSTSSTNGSGRLFVPTPPAAPCHASQASAYNATLCSSVIQPGWTTWAFHSADPVSTCLDNWNNDTCLPVSDDVAPCSGAGYPGRVVNVSSSADVAAAVLFARQHDLRLVVKSTGHDFMGRSGAPNSSLSIWTHHLAPPAVPIVLHGAGEFVPQGCSADVAAKFKAEGATTMTAGAGTMMRQIFETLDAHNLTTIGGGGETVSLGGYVTGGGHGLLSPRRGLAADLVVEIEIVMADGSVKTINECQNDDLFWAVRGVRATALESSGPPT